MRVLLVAHDESLAEPLVGGLSRYGIMAEHVTTGAAALAAAPADLVLLDAGLPDLDGAAMRRRWGRAGEAPLIMLTAPGDDAEQILGMALGSGDCLPKPVDVQQLADRVKAASRPVRVFGPLAIDSRNRQVRIHKIPVSLSPKEYELLSVLARTPGAVLARRRILEAVWGPDFAGPSRTLDFHVASLRRKLGDPGWIENRRGVGFRLAVPA
ncbi:response regulator transcription factor [Actinoplanes sp. NPDC051859]|uniref:response regulator transcription factor n=1 Tax=Actinoplanes sp. NPDC051859 TaxID=3363909 RepID=UPI0037912BD5